MVLLQLTSALHSASKRSPGASPSSGGPALDLGQDAPWASSSDAKKGSAALTPRTASTSPSSSPPPPPPPPPPAPRPPRPAAPPPTRTGLAALRRAQQALSAKPAPPIGSSANPLVLDSSSSSGDESDVQVVHERPAGAGQAGEAGKGRRAASGAAASAAAGGGRAGGGGGAGGSGSAAKKALASTGLRGAPSKRALQEQESARKALEVRAKKGLLTEDEKVRYATMQALQASGKAKGGDEACVVS
ncbi:uncharacterized protein RHOBADRAFT_55111 [Rhodotorula graminis WP1]|uniref:Uncharacterized protein n=1 Tax=Rhodotorula graminis (strain WP1) TaxID=578459 RepID=A0A0P9IUZ4_RHOGW|nr:uncharacterized protein RHOBADRAFT_55111 [Rhodotorula graminis WP1]KPV73356.1 hypothetical protein RHOBADRAFT_55111 [Rhodotorula graminis WP1]